MNEQSITITVLVENTVTCQGLKAEHGLSLWVETGDGNFIWDTGQSELLVSNAQRLGVTLATTNHIVLSHGHYDHTGGLLDVLKLAPHAQVLGHPGLFIQRYNHYQSVPDSIIPIGIPFVKHIVEERCTVLTLSPEPVEFLPGIFTTGEIPRETDFENTGGDFFLDVACSKRDPIIDDQALFIKSSQGLIVILGCAHSGVVNTLNYVAKLTRQEKIFAVLGGMHLLLASRDRLERTSEAFARYDVQVIGPCHCSGLEATTYLRSRFPERCVECFTGSRFTFGRKT